MVWTTTHGASRARPRAVAPVLDSAAPASPRQTSPNRFWRDIFLKLTVSLNFNRQHSTELSFSSVMPHPPHDKNASVLWGPVCPFSAGTSRKESAYR